MRRSCSSATAGDRRVATDSSYESHPPSTYEGISASDNCDWEGANRGTADRRHHQEFQTNATIG